MQPIESVWKPLCKKKCVFHFPRPLSGTMLKSRRQETPSMVATRYHGKVLCLPIEAEKHVNVTEGWHEWLNLPSKIMGVASLSTHLCEDKLSYLSCALTIYHYIEIMGRFCRSKLVKQWMQRTEDLLAWPSHFRKYKDDVWKSKDKNILMHFAENWIHADYTSS